MIFLLIRIKLWKNQQIDRISRYNAGTSLGSLSAFFLGRSLATNLNGYERVRFADFEFDSRSGDLRRAGSLLNLPAQPARLLGVLVQRPGEIVTRRELAETIWGPHTFVDF